MSGWAAKKSGRNNEVTVRRGSIVYHKSSIKLPRRLIYFKPNEAGGGGNKLKYKKVGVHAAEDQNQIQPSSWKINHPRSVHTKFYSCD